MGWLTALKIIPWGDVIVAAPAIAKSARQFFARTKAPGSADAAVSEADDLTSTPQQRIVQIENRLTRLSDQQHASAELIEALARQNAKAIEAIDILRLRTKLLFFIAVGMLALVVALAAYTVR